MEEENNGDLNTENTEKEETELEETPEEEPTNEEPSGPQEEKDWEQIAKDQRKRAEKAEAKLKDAPKETPEEKPTPKNDSTLTREEAILFAKGMNEDDVEDAKFLAERRGVSILEATDTREFKVLKKERDDEKKVQEASLGASKGSKTREKKDFSTPGLSRDQHEALFKQKFQ